MVVGTSALSWPAAASRGACRVEELLLWLLSSRVISKGGRLRWVQLLLLWSLVDAGCWVDMLVEFGHFVALIELITFIALGSISSMQLMHAMQSMNPM